MPIFSARSKANLLTCDPLLQQLFHEVIKHADCAIICGHRGELDQTVAFNSGASKLPWPKSRHNKKPSQAVDVIPMPVDWDNIAAFMALAAIIKEVAARLGIEVEWGGDWQKFKDYPHWQLVQSEIKSA